MRIDIRTNREPKCCSRHSSLAPGDLREASEAASVSYFQRYRWIRLEVFSSLSHAERPAFCTLYTRVILREGFCEDRDLLKNQRRMY
jgi:hypothetical protein